MIFRSSIGLLISILAICTTSAWANINSPGIKLSAYGGTGKTNINPSSFTLIGHETEVLAPYQHLSYDATGGLGAAYRFLPPNKAGIYRYIHDFSLGLDAFYFETTQRGDTFDYMIFDNYNYQMKVKSTRLMANAEWTFPSLGKYIYPFIEGGIGVASNSATYADAPNANAEGGVGVSISKDTSTQFAYDVGAGVKLMVTKNIEASFRYLYADLGSATTSNNANLPLTSPINISLRTQVWLVGLSYLF